MRGFELMDQLTLKAGPIGRLGLPVVAVTPDGIDEYDIEIVEVEVEGPSEGRIEIHLSAKTEDN